MSCVYMYGYSYLNLPLVEDILGLNISFLENSVKTQLKGEDLTKSLLIFPENLFKPAIFSKSMEKQPKPLFKLSPSSLNLFIDCPRCFWLQVVKKVKRPDGAFPSLPSGMDKVLKEHFDRFMEQGTLPPELHTN